MRKWLITLLIGLGFFIIGTLSIIFLPKLIFKRYLPTVIIIFLITILFLFLVLFILFFTKFSSTLAEEFGFMKAKTVPYADITEIRKFILDFFMNDNRNPVNLELTEHKYEGIVSVGREEQKTEIYIGKFFDRATLSRDIYYVASRVDEPNKMLYVTRKTQPSFEEEEKIFNRLANKLAKAPEQQKVTELKIVQTPFGEEKIQTVREPIMQKQEDLEGESL